MEPFMLPVVFTTYIVLIILIDVNLKKRRES